MPIQYLTKITDLSKVDFDDILERAISFKQMYDKGIRRHSIIEGKAVALVFEKPSLRTKVSIEVAIKHLGGTPIFLSSSQILNSGNNMRGRESIPDIGMNLERFCDLIVARVYSHQTIEELAKSVKIPVINALCDQHHPCQALADIMTIKWHVEDAVSKDMSIKKTANRERTKKIKVAFVGDGNNVATSLMQACVLAGYDFTIATPKGFEIPEQLWREGLVTAKNKECSLNAVINPKEAVKGADCVYTDTFVSMGQEAEYDERIKLFSEYQVNSKLLQLANEKAIFMHCLPAHRGEEVTDEVMDSKASVVFDQAECRLHIAMALLSKML